MTNTPETTAGSTPSPGWTTLLWLGIPVCLFPFVYLTAFNLPLFDEFVAMHFRRTMSVWEYQQLLMSSWSGRYTANLLEHIYPLQLNLAFFKILPMLVMLAFIALIWLNVRTLIDRGTFLFSLLLFLVLLNFAPSPGDLIYYTPALIIYTIAFLLVLLMLKIWTSSLQADTKLYLLSLFHLVILGTSETVIPPTLFYSGLLLIGRIRNKQPLLPAIINLLAVCASIGVLLSISGNMTRLDTQGNPPDLMHCIYNYVRSFSRWTLRALPAFPYLLLIVAAMYRWAPVRVDAVADRIRPAHLLTALVIYPLLFAPLFFINLSNYKRLGNVFFFYFGLMSVLFLIKYIPQLRILSRIPKWLAIALIGLFPFAGNIRTAYTDIRHGYSREQYRSLVARYEKLENLRGSQRATVTPVPKTDYLISIQDVNDKNDLPIPNPYRPFMFYFEIDTIVETTPALP